MSTEEYLEMDDAAGTVARLYATRVVFVRPGDFQGLLSLPEAKRVSLGVEFPMSSPDDVERILAAANAIRRTQ